MRETNQTAYSFRQKIIAFIFLLIFLPACGVLTPARVQPALTANPAFTGTFTVTKTMTSTTTAPGTITGSATSSPVPSLSPSNTSQAKTTPTPQRQGAPGFDVESLINGPTPTAIPQPVRPTPGPSTPTVAPTPSGTGSAAPTAENEKTLFDDYLPRGKQVAETEHFLFYAQDNYIPIDLKTWEQAAEETYAYDRERLHADSPVKIRVAFLAYQKTDCPIRGLASTQNPPMILLYADPGTSLEYLKAVLSHEVGHAINAQGFPGGISSDTALAEGLATYTSGKYWEALNKVNSLDEYVRKNIEAGTYTPLPEAVNLPKVYPWQPGAGKDCLVRRDQIYTEWGSFIGYLVDTYGWDKVRELMRSAGNQTVNGKIIDYPSDYQGIFGKALNQLEVDWLKYVMAQPSDH